MSLSAADAKRNALVLSAAQAIIGSANPVALSVGGLVGYSLLGPDKSLATAPVTAFVFGMAVGALPAAALIRAIGQRNGFQTGTVITALGGIIATMALLHSNFWLFAAALAVLGVGNAFVQQFRFAAADNAPPEFKAQAISFVLAGGVVTAVLGPQIVIFTRELLQPVMFAGSFASIIVLAVVGAIILLFLRQPSKNAQSSAVGQLPARPLGEIVAEPRFLAAMICGVGSYALMSFVMTGAPLAMVGCGFTTDEATLGISWHVMAMFGPSFFTGKLIQRFGAETMVAIGLVLLILCAVVALSGIQLWQFWTALILLGVGWNFAFIGSTAIVAETYRPSEKGKVQGFHDLVLFSTVAFASLMAGATYNAWGWNMLNWIVFPVCFVCIAALAVVTYSRRRRLA